jgi:tRNA nucleotidyltransferase (CCA-adding enzyme)
MNHDRRPIPEEVRNPEIEPSKEYSIPLPEDFLKLFDEAGLEDHKKAYQAILDLAKKAKAQGARALIVGGAVRDYLNGSISKDFDVEVYGVTLEELDELVSDHEKTKEIGKSFGVVMMAFPNGVDIDVSLPRKDSKTGPKHNDVKVEYDPNMSIKEACKRRDITINTVSADPLTGELFDPYGGAEDLQNKVLRVTDKVLFKDDSVRVLRAMQFAGRFELSIDPDSLPILQETAPELIHQAPERIYKEWDKLLMKAEKPSIGLQAGMDMGVFDVLHPQLPPLDETEQEHEWHPEGNVWKHTLMVVDEAKRITKENNLDDENAQMIVLAALCHDLGKPATTVFENGRIRSNGHEAAGEEPTREFLKSIGYILDGTKRGDSRKLVHKIVNLVKEHLRPTMFYLEEHQNGKKISNGTIRRLAERLFPATIQELVMVAEADHFGRETLDGPVTEFPAKEWLLGRARQLEVEDSKPAHLISGKDWMKRKYRQGTHIGLLVRLSNELRDDHDYTKDMVLEATDGMSEKEAVKKLEELLAD